MQNIPVNTLYSFRVSSHAFLVSEKKAEQAPLLPLLTDSMIEELADELSAITDAMEKEDAEAQAILDQYLDSFAIGFRDYC